MRPVVRTLTLVVALAVVTIPTQARAEAFVSPWAGVTFGNEDTHALFGADVAFMSDGWAGFEFDFGYAPDFFGEVVDNYLMTGMLNLIIGAPIGGTSGPGIRPYAVVGLGVIRTRFELPDFSASNNDAGFNVGAGLIGFFNDHIGLRGDVRYFRNFDNVDLEDLDLGGRFDFWRAAIGLVLR
jgi:hypothetical protein